MKKTILKDKKQSGLLKQIGDLLSDQTGVILSAVDTKVAKLERRIDSFDTKLDKLVTSIDRFLKKTMDLEDEFAAMKNDINRVKKILREKLGVSID
jgi:peptidoglycan hydrolase CwlO-like protein